MSAKGTVLIGRVGAAHGVRGEVRMKSFTGDPMSAGAYGPLAAADGRVLEIAALRPAPGATGTLIVRFKGIDDRSAAEALTGTDLSVPRDRLPPPEDDDYYHADLIGLEAVSVSGEPIGTVIAVPNYGAGDLIEVAPPRGEPVLIPFTRAAVPEVDIAGGRIVVDPPPGLLEAEAEEGE
jgi:16S rRNA processing protein RimM